MFVRVVVEVMLRLRTLRRCGCGWSSIAGAVGGFEVAVVDCLVVMWPAPYVVVAVVVILYVVKVCRLLLLFPMRSEWRWIGCCC